MTLTHYSLCKKNEHPLFPFPQVQSSRVVGHRDLHTLSRRSRIQAVCKPMNKQESIPVGCVPPACILHEPQCHTCSLTCIPPPLVPPLLMSSCHACPYHACTPPCHMCPTIHESCHACMYTPIMHAPPTHMHTTRPPATHACTLLPCPHAPCHAHPANTCPCHACPLPCMPPTTHAQSQTTKVTICEPSKFHKGKYLGFALHI